MDELRAFFDDCGRRGRSDESGRDERREVIERPKASGKTAMRGDQNALCTSAEMLQVLLHACIPVNRRATFDAALALAGSCIPAVFPIEAEGGHAARLLADCYCDLGACDLILIAVCRRHAVAKIETTNRGLAANFGG